VRRTKQSTKVLVASLVAVSMVVGACSSGDSTDTATTVKSAESSATTVASSGAATTAKPGTPVPETLNIQVSEFATLNPFKSSGVGRGTVNAVMYLPLVYLDETNTVVGAAAESFKVSADGLTTTFKLKQGLQWSDGEKFDADDVVWSLKKYLTGSLSTWASRHCCVVGQADGTFGGIKKVDDYTVDVTLEKLDPTWLVVLAAQSWIVSMLPEHALSKFSDTELGTTNYFETKPLTLGAYKFVEWKKDEYVLFERNEKWPKQPAFAKVKLKFLQSDVAAAQLETGELAASSSVAPIDAKRLTSKPSIALAQSPGVYPEVLQFAVDNPALKDPRIRQAMIYALDLDAICKEVMLGYCAVQWNQVRLRAPKWAIPTEGLEPYKYDPAKAKKLLADAGWKADQKVTIINTGGADRVRSTESLIIQASFAAVGIKAEILSTDTATLLNYAKEPSQRGAFFMFINRGAHFAADPNQVSPYTRCSTFYPKGANLSFYCDPELDALWDKGLTSTDPAVRGPIYQQAFKKISANPDVVNLYWPDALLVFNKSLKGIKGLGQPEWFTWNLADWKWEG
jgi:ABC-type transport system substrate-binding protein